MMNRRILLIDDDPVLIKLLESKLKESGYTVLAATDGASGLKKAKKEQPGLIIADYLMPQMDGFTFYKTLKKDKEISHIPVIILTERAQMEESFKALGVEVFLTKPFIMEGILSKVNEYMIAQEGQEPEVEFKTFKQQSFKKVLICGPIKYVVQDMVLQLQGVGCQTQVATNSIEVVNKALEFDPDVILVDVAMGDVPGHKIITVLRNMSKMINKVILAYNYFPQEGSDSLSLLENMGSEDYKASVCMAAGATEFLGRFTPSGFLTRMQRYLFPGN